MASTNKDAVEKSPPLSSSSESESKRNEAAISSSIYIDDRYASTGIEYGGRPVESVRTSSSKSRLDRTFIYFLAGNRMMKIDIQLNKEELSQPIQANFTKEDKTYSVISSKILDDGESGGMMHCKPKKIRLYYLLTKGNGLEPIDPKTWLENIADFGSMSIRKIVARLELFQSPAASLMSQSAMRNCDDPAEEFVKVLDADVFIDIEEKGHTGCGFICEHLLKELLKGAPKVDANKALCGQVRIFAPSKGIYKGMLQKKQMPPEHKNKILLPTSMQKVKASRHASKYQGRQVGYLIFCKAGIDPSSYNNDLGKLINHTDRDEDGNDTNNENQNPKPPPSFIPKELKAAMITLLIALGAPTKMVHNYVRIATRKRTEKRVPKCHHTFLRGTNDPTGKIPPNHVFLTGFRDKSVLGDTIFITRCPCIKPSDGCRVKVITEKPEGMTDEEYNWLNESSMGVVMFGMPSEGMKPLPERIANGDLDGDRYFVLWDKMLLDNIDVDVIEDEEPLLEEELNNANGNGNKSDDDWFSKVQAALVDLNTMNMWNLVGKLYAACMKVAKNDEERTLNNPDALAFADAYYQAIDNGKHGTTIFLPLHLWTEIPRCFHQHLQTMEGIKFGSLVEKDFGSEGTFVGEVREYRHDKDTKGHYLKVAYTDGDSEELTLEELKRLKPYKGPRPTFPRVLWKKCVNRQPRQNPPSPRKRQKKSSSASTKRQTNGKKKNPPAKRQQKKLSKKSQKKKPKSVKLTRYERDLNLAFLNSLIGSEAGNNSELPNNTKKHPELQDEKEREKSHAPCDNAPEIASEEHDEGGGKNLSVKKHAHAKKKLPPKKKKIHRKSLPKKSGKKTRKTKKMTCYERDLNLAAWNSLIDLELLSSTPHSSKDNSGTANSKNQGSFSDLKVSTADKDKHLAELETDDMSEGTICHDHTPNNVIAGVTTNDEVSSDDDRPNSNNISFEVEEEDSYVERYVGFVDNRSSTSDQYAPSFSTITTTTKAPTCEGHISITYQVDDYGEMTPSEIIRYGGTSSLSLCDTIVEELELRDPNLPCAGAALERIYRICLSNGDMIEYNAEMLRKRSIDDLLNVTSGTKPEYNLSIEAKYREVLSSTFLSTIATTITPPASPLRAKSDISTNALTHEGIISIKFHIDDFGEMTPSEIIPFGGTSSLSRCDTILEELESRDPNLPIGGAALERIYQFHLPGGVTFEYDTDMLSKRSIGDFLDVAGTKNLSIEAKYRKLLPASCLIKLSE